MGNLKVKLLEQSISGASRLQGRLVNFTRRMQHHLAAARYHPRRDDVFVATYPKSGTTWMQMIVYQLLTDGDLELGHINDFAPHLEVELIFSMADLEPMPSPRVFKTHMGYPFIFRGPGKYIYVVRHGLDVAISYYHHYQTYFHFAGSFEQFFEMFLRGEVQFGPWFSHVADWINNKYGLNLLLLRYEDLLADLEGGIRKVATHLDVDLASKDLPRILDRCGFAFMKENEGKFDPGKRVKAPTAEANNHFIRKGKAGGWKDIIIPEQLDGYRQEFEKTMAALDLKEYCPA